MNYNITADVERIRKRHLVRKAVREFGSEVLFNQDGEVGIVSIQNEYDGGAGSGNWGHEGRKGKVGGSTPGGGVHNRISEECGTYTSFSKKQKKLASTHFPSKDEFHNLPNNTKVVADLMFGPYSMVYNAKHGMFIGEDGAEMNPDDVSDACDKDTPIRVFIPNEASTNYNKLKSAPSYPPSRLAEAISFTDSKKADMALRSDTGAVWKTLSDRQKKSLRDYTGNTFYSINHSLREGHGTSEVMEKVADITSAIAKNKTKQDMWLSRGVDTDAILKMFNVDDKTLRDKSIEYLIGKAGKDDGFMSCGTTTKSGYSGGSEVDLRIFVPKGSEALYAEPFARFGSNPDSDKWNGESDQSYFSSEMETILQRGSQFQCTKASYNETEDKYYLEIAITGQNAKELSW